MSSEGGSGRQWPVWLGVALSLGACLAIAVMVIRAVQPAKRPSVEIAEPLAVVEAPAAEARGTPSPRQLVATARTIDPVRGDEDRREVVQAEEVAPPPSPPVDPAREARIIELQKTVREEISQQLETRRAASVAQCWEGAAPSANTPSTGFSLNIAVDEAGNEIARGYSEGRDEVPPEVKKCLREAISAPVNVKAPGQSVSVEVYVSFP